MYYPCTASTVTYSIFPRALNPLPLLRHTSLLFGTRKERERERERESAREGGRGTASNRSVLLQRWYNSRKPGTLRVIISVDVSVPRTSEDKEIATVSGGNPTRFPDFQRNCTGKMEPASHSLSLARSLCCLLFRRELGNDSRTGPSRERFERCASMCRFSAFGESVIG